jgi:uncharacterized protein YkwD
MSRTTVLRAAALAAALIAALLAGPAAGQASAAACAHANTPASSLSASSASAAVRCLVNAQRGARGLARLTPSGRLRAAAVAHSRDMVRRRYFDHVSPGGSTPMRRARQAGFPGPTLGEAIGWGTFGLATPAGMVRLFMNSTPHRHVLMHPRVREIGVGIALGTPSDPRASGAVYTIEVGRR